jgi:sensor domain CHASE-containing protein/nitrogen-specific signal transduction histidine kinase
VAVVPLWRRLIVALLLLSLLAAGEFVLRLNQARQYESRRALITAHLSHVRAKLETELNSTLFLTSGLVAYVSAQKTALTESNANALLWAIYANGHNIRNIGIAPDNRLRWIQPLAGNQKAIGLYYPEVPDQWPAIQQAIARRTTIVAGPVALIQGGTGLIARTPVFRADGSYWGLLSMVVDWQKLVRRVGLTPELDGIRIAIRGRDGTGANGAVFFGDARVFDELPVTLQLELPGGTWLLGAVPVGGWQPDSLLRPRLLYILLALLISGMVLSALRDAADRERANEELERRVQARTQALQSSHDTLAQTLASLRQAQDELIRSEKLAALGGMVAGVAHELNTPLGNSLLAATALAQRTQNLRQRDNMRRSEWHTALDDIEQASDIIQRSLTRAAELVTSFKQLAADRTSEQRRRFKLEMTVHDLVTTLEPTLKHASLVIHTEIPPDIELDGYPGLIDQMLMNLIQNAVMHGYNDGRAGRVTLTAHTDASTVVLDITDDGDGIPTENLERVFDPFFTTRLGSGGTGLGLNIVYNIVTRTLGGQVTVSSAAGQGTHFRLRIPMSAPYPAPALT